MRIGILGGTFDPVHTGHLVLAQECWHRFLLDKVIFVPANVSPFKLSSETASAPDRLNMLRIALSLDPRFGISTYELDKEGVSYTVDTMKMFRKTYEDGGEFFFLTGADSENGIEKWKGIDEILAIATFVIATRPGWTPVSGHGKKVEHLEIPAIDVSSTEIRERVRSRRPIDYLVPREVVKYIRNKGLYRP